MYKVIATLLTFVFIAPVHAQGPEMNTFMALFTPERLACLEAAVPESDEPSFAELRAMFACFRGTPLGALEQIFSEESIACMKREVGEERFDAIFRGDVEPTPAEQQKLTECFAGGLQLENVFAGVAKEAAIGVAKEAVQEGVRETVREIGEVYIAPYLERVRNFLDDPRVERVNEQVAAPTAAVVVAANAAAAIPAANFLAYLRYLFTQPLLLLERRKRKGWGVVYHSLTKTPIDLAIVRLTDAPTGAIKRTYVTDRQGRYAFVVTEGKYHVKMTKPDYMFPSAVLAGAKEDEPYPNLYHGESIAIGPQGDTIRGNAPGDPETKEAASKRAARRKKLAKLNQAVAGISPIFAIGSYAISPKPIIGLLAVFHLVLYLFMRRLAYVKKPKGFGTIRDVVTGRPLANAYVRVFRADYDKLAETQVTDRHGRYVFLIGPGEFYVTAERAGYQKLKTPNYDFRKTRASSALAPDINLAPLQQ